MSKAVFLNMYKLKEGASIPDFLQAVEDLNNAYTSKQQGFISSTLMVEGDLWADTTIFETMEDAQKCIAASESNASAGKFFEYLDFNSCKSNLFVVEKSF